MSRYNRTKAVVIKGYNFKESDKIFTLYTLKYGKIKALAKGIKKIHSRFGAILETFNLVDLLIYAKAQQRVVTICGCSLLRPFSASLNQDLEIFSTAAYLIELVEAFSPYEQPHPKVFELLTTGLSALDNKKADHQVLNSAFGFRLLTLLGYQPQLDGCVFCHRLIPADKINFSVFHGGMVCPACLHRVDSPLSINWSTRELIRNFSQKGLGCLEESGLEEEHRREMEGVLFPYIHFHLEKELKTEQFRRKLKNDFSGNYSFSATVLG